MQVNNVKKDEAGAVLLRLFVVCARSRQSPEVCPFSSHHVLTRIQ